MPDIDQVPRVVSQAMTSRGSGTENYDAYVRQKKSFISLLCTLRGKSLSH